MSNQSFGAYLGEFLDKAIMAFDQLATTTELFIQSATNQGFVNQHPADLRRSDEIETLVNANPHSHKETKAKIAPKNIGKANEKSQVKQIQQPISQNRNKFESESYSENSSDSNFTELFAKTDNSGKSSNPTQKRDERTEDEYYYSETE